jgi:hypothetical protein
MPKDGGLNLNYSILYTAVKQCSAQRLATCKELKAVNCREFSKEGLNILHRLQDKHQHLKEIKKKLHQLYECQE